VAAATALRDQPAHVLQGLYGRIIFVLGIGSAKVPRHARRDPVKNRAATMNTVRESSARLYTGNDPLMMMSIGTVKGSTLIGWEPTDCLFWRHSLTLNSVCEPASAD
jgi:hypothetical protein